MSEPTKRYPSCWQFNDDGSSKLVTAVEWLREEATVYLDITEDGDDSVPDAPERVIGMNGIADEIEALQAALTLSTQRAEAAEAQRNNLRRALVDAMVERAVEAYDDAAMKSATTSLCSFKAMRAALDAALAVQP